MPLFPSYGSFNLSEIIHASQLKSSEKILIENSLTAIEQLLVHNMKYADEFHGAFYLVLNEKGRLAQRLGGHLAYLKKQDENQYLADEKLKIDIKNAKRISKTYWWTFGIAIAGLIISMVLLI